MGGVVRESSAIYIIALISYNNQNNFGNNFLMWAGVSFSKDKAGRDMVGIYPYSGDFDDLYSLYASAPFLDTSTNINGTEDYILLSSSGATLYKTSSIYFTQIYRKYDTGDSNGDEVLMFKIKNQYCLAAYFTNDISQYDSMYGSYADKDYMHQLLECFTPSLDLWEWAPKMLFLSLFLIIIAC